MPVALLFVCASLVAGPALGTDWSGHWCGECTVDTVIVPLELEIDNSGPAPAAWLTLPHHGWHKGPALKIEIVDDALVLTFNPRQEPNILRVERRGDALAGSWTWNGFQADTTLRPCTPELPYTTEEAAFSRDGITFGGTLFLPKGPGPHPAIVCYHGSGDNERWWLFDEADHFARLGIACYVWDKRGCGVSGGHWEEADFEVLAEDDIAAVAMLKEHDNIDPERIGVYGISQACWIMPLAASKCPDIRFILAVSGAITTVEEEGYYDYWYRMKQAGYPESDWQEALALLKADNAFTRTAEGWDALMAHMRDARQKPWWKTAEITPAPKGSIWRRFYRGILDFDPVPYVRQLSVPTLWIHGSADATAPTHRSAKVLRELLAEDPGLPFTTVWLEGASHGMRVPAAGSTFPLDPYHPEYWPTVERWLDMTVLK